MCKIIGKVLTQDERLVDATIRGFKPACLVGDFTCCPVKMEIPENCDKISLQNHLTSGKPCFGDYVLNINKVIEIIKNNYMLFIQRLGLNRDCSIDTIYNVIKDMFSRMLGGCTGFQDIEGIVLGFPKQNTMIYTMEKFAGLDSEQRQNPEVFKAKILEAMQREDSPYANIEANERETLEQAVQSINKIKEFSNPLYQFIQYVREPEEMKRIHQSAAAYKNAAGLRSGLY